MRDVLLPQQQGDESLQRRGRKVYSVQLPQQLTSGTPERHRADAAAATPGIKDAATSRPERIAAAATAGFRDAATSLRWCRCRNRWPQRLW